MDQNVKNFYLKNPLRFIGMSESQIENIYLKENQKGEFIDKLSIAIEYLNSLEINYIICGSTAAYLMGYQKRVPNDIDILTDNDYYNSSLGDVDLDNRISKNYMRRIGLGNSHKFKLGSHTVLCFKIQSLNSGLDIDVFYRGDTPPYLELTIEGISSPIKVERIDSVLRAKTQYRISANLAEGKMDQVTKDLEEINSYFNLNTL